MVKIDFIACILALIFLLDFVNVSIGISENKKQEFDFEDLDVESITPNVDINYEQRDAEIVGEELTCECGKTSSPSWNNLDLGTRSVNISSRNESKKSLRLAEVSQYIIGGDKVRRSDIPSMVAITKYQHKKTPRWRVICGGVLLNQRYVLSAAHCVEKRFKDTLEVVFNVDDATVINNDKEVIRRKIERFIIHPAFNSKTIDFDIAIIELKMPLDLEMLKSKVRPICLPKRRDFANRIGTVSGWGYTAYEGVNNGDNSPNLLKVMLPILSHKDCLKTKVPTKNNITSNMFCAGYPDGEQRKDACINDSGGPLTVLEGGRHHLAGLVSWGVGCSLKDYPGVFTKVANFIPWIKDNAKGRWCKG